MPKTVVFFSTQGLWHKTHSDRAVNPVGSLVTGRPARHPLIVRVAPPAPTSSASSCSSFQRYEYGRQAPASRCRIWVSTRRRLAGLPGSTLERDRPRQHRAFGKLPGALVVEADLAGSGYGQEPLGDRPVGPELRVDRRTATTPGAGRPSRTEAKSPVSLRRRGKSCRDLAAGVRHQAIDLVGPVVVDQQKLAVVRFAERHEMKRRPRQLACAR